AVTQFRPPFSIARSRGTPPRSMTSGAKDDHRDATDDGGPNVSQLVTPPCWSLRSTGTHGRAMHRRGGDRHLVCPRKSDTIVRRRRERPDRPSGARTTGGKL